MKLLSKLWPWRRNAGVQSPFQRVQPEGVRGRVFVDREALAVSLPAGDPVAGILRAGKGTISITAVKIDGKTGKRVDLGEIARSS